MFTPQQIELMIKASGGVPVAVGAVSTWGHRDVLDESAFDPGAEVSMERDTVTVATGILPALSSGTAITVDGGAYVVGESRRIEDGAQTLIELEGA